jgi:DNA primase
MEDCGTIVIAEGLMDILSLDNQIGFPILSAHLSKTQLIKLFEKLPKKIILVPDTDKTGKETLQRNIDLIYTYKPASIKTEILIYNIPDEYKDLNEMKIKTGKNYIDDNECEVVKKRQTFSIDKVFGL